MSLLPPKKRFGLATFSAFQVVTMFWTDCTMLAAFVEVGSMQTVTVRLAPVPV